MRVCHIAVPVVVRVQRIGLVTVERIGSVRVCHIGSVRIEHKQLLAATGCRRTSII